MSTDIIENQQPWELDNIDWEAAAKDLGDNVAIVTTDPSKPPLLIKKKNQKLQEIQQKTSSLPWIETLECVTAQRSEIKNANNDLQREVAFYQMTLDCVKDSLDRLNDLQIPYRRPNDFYAEMLKSDQHMARVKARILWEKKKIGVVEARKKNSRLTKFHKQMMFEKNKASSAREKEELNAIETWKNSLFVFFLIKKNHTELRSFCSNRSDKSLQEILRQSRREYLQKKENEKKKKPNMRRIMKDMKYGKSGGGTKMGRSKKNTHMSSKEYFDDFARSGNAAREEAHYKNMKQLTQKLKGNSKNKFIQNKKIKAAPKTHRPSKKQRWKQVLQKVGKMQTI
ncbi:hypothetical protein RFI_26002 [Reticulomyxa filosa]|uniref:Uncharacterized protein n=1 Tax=Reticulomyxa filosa TaxID=46433 RepID=X6MD99_RETFI|nr:hypothetical protein RFI_26002 [Reticulomyxa filosa]|eukprot:ETO11377.1 hypothetical protein RFI_26002 [Reticulomyxa filosa]